METLQNTNEWKNYKELLRTLISDRDSRGSKRKRSDPKVDELNNLLSRAIVETYIKLDENFLTHLAKTHGGYADEHGKTPVLSTEFKQELNVHMIGGGCTAVCAIITPTHVVVG